MPPQGQLEAALSGLKFDVGSEPDLTFTLCQQSILERANRVDPREVRTSDIAVDCAPYRVIPHVLEFGLQTEAQILPDADGLGNGQVLEKFMWTMDKRITRRCPRDCVG